MKSNDISKRIMILKSKADEKNKEVIEAKTRMVDLQTRLLEEWNLTPEEVDTALPELKQKLIELEEKATLLIGEIEEEYNCQTQ